MQPILVAYATTEGQSRKVAEFIAQRLRVRDHRVDLVDVASPAAQQITPVYQAAFLGGSVHHDHHQAALVHFVRLNRPWLAAMPTAFYSVNLAMVHVDGGNRVDAERALHAFLDETGLQPRRVRLVAGALRYTQYDFFKRFMMHALARHRGDSTDTTVDHEYTDWNDIEDFVDEFLAAAVQPQPGVAEVRKALR